jgi:hypothetical protein
MTDNEKELVAALEADIQTWTTEAEFFDKFVKDVELSGRNAVPGREYARGLRQRIDSHKALIERVKKG